MNEKLHLFKVPKYNVKLRNYRILTRRWCSDNTKLFQSILN